MTWGGLRGAVGIALGITLENSWKNVTAADLSGLLLDGDSTEAAKLGELYNHKYAARLWFFLAGGISMLTLFINGTTAGPLIKRLGLANATEVRKSIVERYNKSMILGSLDSLLRHLADSQFSKVGFGAVRARIPYFKDITAEQFTAAVKRVKADPSSKLPDLSSFKAFFPNADVYVDLAEETADPSNIEDEMEALPQDPVDRKEIIEMRKVFTALLGTAYDMQIDNGFVNSRTGFVVEKITASLQKMGDTVAQGEPINDWETSQAGPKLLGEHILRTDADEAMGAVACIEAHRAAQKAFQAEFVNANEKVPPVVATIIAESNSQIRSAEQSLKAHAKCDKIMAQLVSQVLLNEHIHAVGGYVERGLLNSTEAEHLIHALEHYLDDLPKFDGANESAGVQGAASPSLNKKNGGEEGHGSASKLSATGDDLMSEAEETA